MIMTGMSNQQHCDETEFFKFTVGYYRNVCKVMQSERIKY